MDNRKSDEIRSMVREHYGRIGTSENTGCGCSTTNCCGTSTSSTAADISLVMGYTLEEISDVPEGANLGLGCGNPQAIASLRRGETVLDLGSGGGFDSFLAARSVGGDGMVIGVDMTPEMITRSRQNAEKMGLAHVEFRLGEIEHLPVADGIVDVIISNCVINLSPAKDQVFREAFRVLKPGGRLAISDVVRTVDLPEALTKDMALYSECVSGASTIAELEGLLKQAGFGQIRITPKDESRTFIRDWAPGSRVEDFIVSAVIEAVKP